MLDNFNISRTCMDHFLPYFDKALPLRKHGLHVMISLHRNKDEEKSDVGYPVSDNFFQLC